MLIKNGLELPLLNLNLIVSLSTMVETKKVKSAIIIRTLAKHPSVVRSLPDRKNQNLIIIITRIYVAIFKSEKSKFIPRVADKTVT